MTTSQVFLVPATRALAFAACCQPPAVCVVLRGNCPHVATHLLTNWPHSQYVLKSATAGVTAAFQATATPSTPTALTPLVSYVPGMAVTRESSATVAW